MHPVGGPRKLVGLVVASLLAAVALAGCGNDDDPVLDRRATEKLVAEVVSERIAPEIVRTRCQANVPIAEGEHFDCDLNLAATVGPRTIEAPADPEGSEGRLVVRVTQVDADGGLEVELLQAVVTHADVVLDLEAQLKAEFGRSFDATCGPIIHRVVFPKGTFTCRARDKAGPRTVQVTVLDTAGTLRYDVLD